jgi:hypothetical protein
VETPETPLVLVFRLDASALPPAFVLANLTIFRNGVIVPNCAGAPGEAAPDPCVASRTLLGDGDASVAVRTSAASTWTFAIPNCNDLPSEIAGLSVAGQANPTLSWNGQGAGRFYDVISSTLADLRAHGTATASCLANDIVQTTYGDTRPGPAPSDGYYYLIRAQDPCGAGSYGVNSSGLPHQPVAACP